MKIQINQKSKADTFTALFQHIKSFTEHINIMFQEDKLFIQALDNSRVSIFEIHIPAAWFDVYTLSAGVTLGLHSVLLYKILSTRDAGQCIHIEYMNDSDGDGDGNGEQNSDRLYFHFTSEPVHVAARIEENNNVIVAGFAKHFDMPLIDIESEIMHIPLIEYQAEFSMLSATFSSLIQQLQLFGDTVQFECSEEKVQLCSTSSESGKMSVEIPIDDLSEFSINEGETMDLSFGLMHLRMISQYSKIAKEVDVKLSSTYPICIRYVFDIGADEASSARIMFYLAPKMTNDD